MIRTATRTLNVIALPVLASLFAGCTGDGGVARVDAFRPAEACTFPASPSRWADGGDHRETGRAGDDEELWFANIGGVYWSAEGLYVYDAMNTRVVRLTEDLEFVGSFGREGDGPGEFPRRMVSVFRPARRIHGGPDGILIYEERRVSVFDPEGRYQGNLIADPFTVGMSPMTRGLRWTPSGVLFDAGGHDAYHLPDAWTDSVSYRVQRWAGDTIHTIAEILVARAPRGPRGAQYLGPRQARPAWDAAGGCVVMTDGASPWLVVASLDGREADTVSVELPERDPPAGDRATLERLSAQAGGGTHLPEPTVIARIRDLILDPDGHVWLLPNQPDPAPESGVEVLRIALGSGRTVVDTVPAFPVAFGPPGVYYATIRAAMDEQMVARYELAAAGGEPADTTPKH
ncbi:MAG TPA: hypothetical protein VF212_10730 [Longimicrobiales bacterium]